MAWPLSQDYNEAIQDPASCFGEPDLKGGQPVLNALGMPMPRSGNFADVYEFLGGRGARWAIKCFTRQIPGLRERYQHIGLYLEQVKLPFMVAFTFLDKGIRIRGDWYPVLKMDWVEGFTLNQLVKNHLDKPQILDTLCQIWVKLARRLRQADIAHCDLQHGNVLLVPGSKAGTLGIKLVDYDGMCVPALTLLKSIELGHPSYQHPQRLREGIYSLEVDRLSHLVIYTALRSLMAGGRDLWERNDNGDNLLFRETDLRQPGQSALFKELWSLPDAAVHDLVGYLTLGVTGPLAQTPLLEDVVSDQQTRALSRDQEQQVTALLGPGVRVNRPAPVKPATPRTANKDATNSAAGTVPVVSAISAEVSPPASPFAFVEESLAPARRHAAPSDFDSDGEDERIPPGTRRRTSAGGNNKGLVIGIGAASGALVTALVLFLVLRQGPGNDAAKTTRPESGADKGKELVKRPDENLPTPGDKPDIRGKPDDKRRPHEKGKPDDKAKPPEIRKPPTPPVPDKPIGPDPRAEQGDPPIVVQGKEEGFKPGPANQCLVFAPTGGRTLAGNGNQAQLWEIPSGKEIFRLKHPSQITCAAFSPKGDRALLGGGLNEGSGAKRAIACAVQLWDLDEKMLLATFVHSRPVHTVCFSPDGRRAVSSSGFMDFENGKWNSRECQVILWDLEGKKWLKKLDGLQAHAIWSTFTSAETVYFITKNGEAWSWDLESGTARKVTRDLDAATSKDRSFRAILSGREVHVVAKDGRVAHKYPALPMPPSRLEISADFRRAAVACQEDTAIHLYDLEKYRKIATLNGHRSAPLQLAFSPDGHYLLSSCTRYTKLWDLERLRDVEAVKTQASPTPQPEPDTPPEPIVVKGTAGNVIQGVAGEVHGLAFSPKSRYVVTASHGVVQKWELPSGRLSGRLDYPGSSVNCVAVSPDGRRLLSGTGEITRDRSGVVSGAGGTVRLVDVKTGKLFKQIKLKGGLVNLAFFPDGRRAAAVSTADARADPLVQVLDLIKGKAVKEFTCPGGAFARVAFSANGLHAFSFGAQRSQWWDLRSPDEPDAFPHRCFAGAIDGDGRHVLGVDRQGLRLWDRKGNTIHAITGLEGAARSLFVSVDGRRALAVCDSTLHLLDLEKGWTLATFHGHKSPIQRVGLSPDGRYAVSASSEQFRLWDLKKLKLMAPAPVKR